MFEKFLMHVGVAHDDNPPGRGSGRYGFGTGENPMQHMENMTLGQQKAKLMKDGYSEKDAAYILGYKTTSELRAAVRKASEEALAEKSAEIEKLYSKGITSPTAISRELGIPEGTVRSYIKNSGKKTRLEKTNEVKDQLKERVKQDKYIDVGIGTEYCLGISEEKKKHLLKQLEDEGYELHNYYQTQLGTGKRTTTKILCPPGVTTDEMLKDFKSGKYEVHAVDRFIENVDGTRSILGLPPVNSVDQSRIQFVNDPDRDGLIELRRNVDDISLGRARYAQVRIGVDGKYYMKGMAVYGDNVPEGKDIVFYHSKGEDAPIEGKILKNMKENKFTGEVDKDNPFGASIKNENELVFGQRYYIDPKTGEKKVSAINIVNEEGDWTKWSRNTPSQFLSKQQPGLIKQQLNLSYLQKKDEFSDIKSIQNESVKRVMLENFAENCDKAAVDLKGASLPRQQTHVLLPLKTLKDNEIYAPNYQTGEEVILVRYPHEGTFEIPRLVVNNNNKEGKRIIGNSAPDAVGIPGVAARQLSGADFDGDSASVIPYRTYPGSSKYNQLKTDKAIKDLVDFDPKHEYPAYEGMTKVKDQPGWDKQQQMGSVSNLITDMTLFGAPTAEIIKATRHAMVIIDAEKHNLDWKKSEKDNEIKALKKKWQGREDAGAASIISRASAMKYKAEEELRYEIDPVTGAKITLPTGKTKKERKVVGKDEKGNKIYADTGRYVPVMQKSTKMREAKDAYELVSNPKNPNEKERLYADYANQMKQLANEARLEYAKTPTAKKNIESSKAYAKEAQELENLVTEINKNAPRERLAQRRASTNYYKKKREREDLDKDDLKKLKNQCLAEARFNAGASPIRPNLTPKQWQAIENHAISGTKAEYIIKKMQSKDVLSYALPKEGSKLSDAKIALIKAYGRQGSSISEIAEEMGVSTSTVQKYLMGS